MFSIPFEEYRVIKVRIVLVKVIMNFKLTFFFVLRLLPYKSHLVNESLRTERKLVTQH